MRTTHGYQHKGMYHIFKNLEFICIQKGYEPLFLPWWTCDATKSHHSGVHLLSPNAKVYSCQSDPTPIVLEMAMKAHQIRPMAVQKYFYQYFYPSSEDKQQDEMIQRVTAGFEIFNLASPMAESEVIRLCLALTHRLNLGRVHLEIGHAGFTEAFLSTLSLSLENRQRLRVLLAQKNVSAVSDFSKRCGLSLAQTEAIKHLMSCFGPMDEVFKKVQTMTLSEQMKQAIFELEALSQDFKDLMDDLHVDLGFSNELEYYTGPVFKLFSYTSHQALFSGGRYDKPEKDQESKLPACGANLLIPNILEVMMMTNFSKPNPQRNNERNVQLIRSIDTDNLIDALSLSLKANGIACTVLDRGIPKDLAELQQVLSDQGLRWLVYPEGANALRVIDNVFNQSYKTSPNDLLSLLSVSVLDTIH